MVSSLLKNEPKVLGVVKILYRETSAVGLFFQVFVSQFDILKSIA